MWRGMRETSGLPPPLAVEDHSSQSRLDPTRTNTWQAQTPALSRQTLRSIRPPALALTTATAADLAPGLTRTPPPPQPDTASAVASRPSAARLRSFIRGDLRAERESTRAVRLRLRQCSANAPWRL